MFCFNCDPSISPTQEAKRLIKILRSLNYSFMFLILFKLIIGDINGLINDLIVILAVLITYRTASYIAAAITIFILLLQILNYLTIFGLIIQNSYLDLIKIDSAAGYLYVFIVVISLFYYFAYTHFTFRAYKEFKAIYQEESSSSYNYRKYII
jgi:hypothetical protein